VIGFMVGIWLWRDSRQQHAQLDMSLHSS